MFMVWERDSTIVEGVEAGITCCLESSTTGEMHVKRQIATITSASSICM